MDGAPKPVKEKVTKAEAEDMKKKLEEVGATVEVNSAPRRRSTRDRDRRESAVPLETNVPRQARLSEPRTDVRRSSRAPRTRGAEGDGRQIQCGRRVRQDFGKIPSIVEIPNLIEIQQQLLRDVSPEGRSRRERREEMGLQAVFKSVFPIPDYNENASLEFDSYHFGDPKYTVEECHDRGMTFAIPLKVTLRLVVFDHDKEAKTRTDPRACAGRRSISASCR